MNYDEQQINRSLQCLEEQEEFTNFRYDLTTTNRINQAIIRQRQSDISEWGGIKESKSLKKKKNKFPYLKEGGRQKEKRYTYFLDLLDESQEKSFNKYQKLPAYRIQKQKQPAPAPKRVDLKLPLPHIADPPNAPLPLYQSESSLPLIKKIALPVKLLRRQERMRHKEENDLKLQDLSGFLGIGDHAEESPKRNMLLASTRRQIKSFHSYSQRNPRVSLDNNKLKECITFIK